MELNLKRFEEMDLWAPNLKVPLVAYGLCFDEGRDVLLLYPDEEFDEAA